MRVCEIFYSLQGESTFQGLPCYFIRTTGCNLRCSYCDTRYAYEEGYNISPGELLDKVETFRPEIIEITGGEPLIQKDIPSFIKKLVDRKYTVLVETNGSINIDIIDRRVIRLVDIKCPSSGMKDRMDFNNLKRLTEKDELKFIIGNEEDYKWAKKILNEYDLSDFRNVIFIPVYGVMSYKELARWILRDRLMVRFQLQLHKLIWGRDVRGR